MCDEIWEDKVYICAEARSLRKRQVPQHKSALKLSIEDSKRTWLTEEELTSLKWNFRFKAQAGPHWQLHDPYWTKGEAAQVQFMSDGGLVNIKGFDVVESLEIHWQWGLPTAGRSGPHGSFVQLFVSGAKVPTYVVTRHAPNWGFLMQSCWVVYTSFKMPRRGDDPSLDDESLEISIETQLREARLFNIGAGGGQQSDSEGDEDDTDESEGEDAEEEEQEEMEEEGQLADVD